MNLNTFYQFKVMGRGSQQRGMDFKRNEKSVISCYFMLFYDMNIFFTTYINIMLFGCSDKDDYYNLLLERQSN